MINNDFVVIICVRNAEKYIERCIQSIKDQTFKEWKCIIVDDCSEDNTYINIKKIVLHDNRFKLIKNEKREYAMANIYNTINEYCKEENDIIAIIDGDDYLYDNDSLSKIKNEHENYDVVYGEFIMESNGGKGWGGNFPSARYRITGILSHFKTFKQYLFKNIKENDLKDKNGNFYKFTYDKAMMIPILEMAGKNNIKFIKNIMYVYNNLNVENVHKKNGNEQYKIMKEILNKKEYKVLVKKK